MLIGMLADPRAVIASAASGLRPDEPISAADWADRFAFVRHDGDAAPRRWDTARAEYQRGILEAASDPRVRQVTIMKAERVGGTEAVRRVVGWMIDRSPRRILWVYPTRDIARRHLRLELWPSITATPALRDRLVPGARARVGDEIRFDRCTVVLEGSQRVANLEGVGYGGVVVDEFDRCAPDVIDIVRGRGRTSRRSIIVLIGTPQDASAGIHRQYHAGTRRRYAVPCPHCLAYHHREFSMVRWPGRNHQGRDDDHSRDPLADPSIVRAHAHMICPSCGATISASSNSWQVERGVWLAHGQSIGPASTSGGWTPGEIRGDGGWREHESFHIHGLLSVFPDGVNPYGEAALEWVEARGHPGPEWSRRRLGEPITPDGESTPIRVARERIERAHRLGVVPADVVCLTAGVDVQSDRAYVELQGLTGRDESGQRAYIVAWTSLHCPSSLAPLAEWLGREWKTADGRSLKIRAAFVDSGHRTNEVYSLARERPIVVPVKGEDGPRIVHPWRQRVIDRFTDGRPIPGGVRLLLVNTGLWKRVVQQQLRPAADEERGGGTMTLGSAPTLVFPADTPYEYFEQVTSERLVPQRIGARTEWRWVLVPGRRANHALDCRVYQLAGADSMSAHLLRPRLAVPAPVPAPAPDLARASPPARGVERSMIDPGPLLRRARETDR